MIHLKLSELIMQHKHFLEISVSIRYIGPFSQHFFAMLQQKMHFPKHFILNESDLEAENVQVDVC